jgi:hypothetical protein
MVNSFRKSLMYRAAPRWSSAFMRSQPNKSTGPKRGTPTHSRGQRNATGWSSAFRRSQRPYATARGDRVNSGLLQGLHATDSLSGS